MKLYKDGQLVGELLGTETKQHTGVNVKKPVVAEAVEDKHFSIGDKVEIIGESYFNRSTKIGEIGMITKFHHDDLYYVYEKDGNDGIYSSKSLKRVLSANIVEEVK